MSNQNDLGGSPMVSCSVCDSIVNQRDAVKRGSIETPAGPAPVWVCKACLRHESGKPIQKYIMKERKIGR